MIEFTIFAILCLLAVIVVVAVAANIYLSGDDYDDLG